MPIGFTGFFEMVIPEITPRIPLKYQVKLGRLNLLATNFEHRGTTNWTSTF